MRLLGSAFVATLLALLAAACEGEPLEQSCDGDRVSGCEPYAYAVAREASLEPSGLRIGDSSQTAHFVVQLATCGAKSPRTHDVVVQVISRGSSLGDAGAAPRITDLVTLHDDGTSGDPVAGDGTIDVTIANPFFGGDIPENADVTLRFEPRMLPSCVGGALEVPYRTGARFTPGGL